MPKSSHQQEATTLLDVILNNSEMLIMILDSDGHIQQFNCACENLSGYDSGEIKGEYLWDCMFIPKGDDSDCQKNFQSLKNGGDSRPGKDCGRWLSRGGEWILIDWQTIPIRNAEGDLEYLVALGTDISAQKAMQEALQEREAESRALFEQAAIGIAYVAPEGRWLDVNARLCEIVGYERDYLLATTFQAITYPDDLDMGLDYENKVLRNEIQTYSMEKRYIRSDGSLTWVNLTVSLVRDMDGKPDYFISLIRDINQRKETELLLRHSERQLREAQRITHIGSWELDLINNKLHWSDEIYRMFEIEQGKFGASYEAFLNAIHPEDREAVNKAYTQSLHDRKDYEIAHRLLMLDGRIKWVNERCESTFAADGTPVYSLGTVQDITAQVKNEQELRELNHSLEQRVSQRTYELASERNFISTILDTISALVLVLDARGHIVRVNRACEELLGYSQVELEGRFPWDVLVSDEKREAMSQVFAAYSRGEEPPPYEIEWYSKDSTPHIIARTNTKLSDPDGKLQYIIMTGIDISESKAAEQEIISARDKAEQASQVKGEFLSRMSHELRTPLNAILGFSQLLETDTETPLNPVQHDSVREILRAGNHLLELINEILDMTRAEAGRLDLNMEAVTLAPLLEDCIGLVQAQAEQRDIRLQLEPSVHEDSQVLADAVRVKQVILILLSNAVKYNRDQGLVRMACSVQANAEIRIEIYDTGEGLNAEQQAILFAPFERLDADIKAIPGTGTGLALAKRLTELMGGSIGVESEIGKGSMFWVQLGTPQVSGERA